MPITPYQKFIFATYNGTTNTALTQATNEGFVSFNNLNDYVELQFPRRYEDSNNGRNFEEIIPLDATITGIQYKFVVQRTTVGLPTGLTVTHRLDDAVGYTGESTVYSWTSGTTVFESAVSLFGLSQLLRENIDQIKLRFEYTDDDPNVNNRFQSKLFSSPDGPSIALRVQYSLESSPLSKKITITGGTKVNIKKTTQTSTDYSYATGYGAGGGIFFPQNVASLLPENNGEATFLAGDTSGTYSSAHYIFLGSFDWEDEIFPSNAVFDSITIKYSVKRESGTEIGTTRLIYRLRDTSSNIVNKLSVPFTAGDYHNIEDTITSPNFSFNFFNNFQGIQFFWRNDLADTDTGEFANNDYDNGLLYINGNEGFDPQIKINYTIPSPTKVILGS